MKLGSLFDGSGGFPLAGVINGITPVWASEIEPFPIRVTKNRFPSMKHLGSVTDINGAEIEPVDIITFGSPCQDLSVAGKRAGIHEGERSSLFFEAIRIIKEMRDATANQFPRFTIWENVPGAFSSNKGEDFRAVLQAFCDLWGRQETAIPQPPKGRWTPAGAVVGDGASLAWRVYDAQFWGVPQRRKRIYLIADFGSERAGEILFERESLPGDSESSGEAGKDLAGDAPGGAGRSDRVRCLNPWDLQSQRQFDADGVFCTIHAPGGGFDRSDRSGCNGKGWSEKLSYTLNTMDRHAVCYALDAVSSNSMKSKNPNSGFHEETIARTLDCHQDPTCNQGGNVILILNDQGGGTNEHR